MSDGAMQEIGCQHDFGTTHLCPFCGAPRSMSTDKWVTSRYINEHPGQGGYSWPPPFDEAARRSWRGRLARLLRLVP